jgi:hypothetical protein
MGNSAKEAAKNLLTAFKNKQAEPYPASDGGILLVKEMNARTGKFDAKAKKIKR